MKCPQCQGECRKLHIVYKRGFAIKCCAKCKPAIVRAK
jgi:hypothetical protein